jgi:glycine/serine hydroxymethyltransferase
MLVDLTAKDVTGKAAEKGLDRAFLTCNKNGIPFDTRSPFVTSGIRLGTPAGTTRGFGPAEFRKVGKLIAEVVEGMKNGEKAMRRSKERAPPRSASCAPPFPSIPGGKRPRDERSAKPRQTRRWVEDAKAEVKGMAKEGMAPSLDQAGADRRAVGAVAGGLLPVVSADRR